MIIYENCKCRKKSVDKLVEECTETNDKVELAKITSAENENKHKHSSCTLYIVLFSIIFTVNIGIGTSIFQTTITKRNSIKLINGKDQTN